MINKEVIIIGILGNELIDKEIEKVAIACNLSFIELKQSIECFSSFCEFTADSIKDLTSAITSSNFRLIDYPKKRTSVIPPNFYRKRF